jgi:hypothetical protein
MKPGRALLAIALWMGVLPWLAAPATAQDALHEVVAGDGLRSMAGYYYGDTRQWERIWNANRDQIRNPNRVERGRLLRIPDAKVPAEPYAQFLARIWPAAPVTAVPRIEVPPVPRSSEVSTAAGEAGTRPPEAPAAPGKVSAPVAPPQKKSPPAAPVKAAGERTTPPAPVPAPVKGPVPAAAPAVPPSPAAAPAAPAPSKQAGPPVSPPPTTAAPRAPGQTKAPAARPAPPPPPKEWYEELLSPEIFTSLEFLAGAGVLLLGLLGLFFWRRRAAAQAAA